MVSLFILRRALRSANREHKPVAFIVAGHNGSGKSTLWYQRLADRLQIPLVNADRLTLSILPPPISGRLPAWAQRPQRQGCEMAIAGSTRSAADDRLDYGEEDAIRL